MRYFLDTEFIEKPCFIQLISIGLVSEDSSRQFYAEVEGVDWGLASDWVLNNVKPHLQGGDCQMYREEIGPAVLKVIGDDPNPEFWGYYADYDWVVFCWLFGSMVDLPKGWPMYCRDIKQLADDLGNPRLPANTGRPHHALDDADWTRDAWAFLTDLQRSQTCPT